MSEGRKRGRPRKPKGPPITDKTHPLGAGLVYIDLECDDSGCGQLVYTANGWEHVNLQRSKSRNWQLLSRRVVGHQEASKIAAAFNKKLPETAEGPEG